MEENVKSNIFASILERRRHTYIMRLYGFPSSDHVGFPEYEAMGMTNLLTQNTRCPEHDRFLLHLLSPHLSTQTQTRLFLILFYFLLLALS